MALNRLEIVSGIYLILNINSGKYYIGSSVDLKKRQREHFYSLRRNNHHNDYLQKSYNKHGETCFQFHILEKTNNLIIREQYWIDNLIPEYNILKLAYRTEGVKRTEKTKIKLSESLTGRVLTQQHKDNLSKAKKGRIITKSNLLKSVSQYTPLGEFINSFISINEASRQTNIGRTSIGNCITGRSKIAGNFKWEYTNVK